MKGLSANPASGPLTPREEAVWALVGQALSAKEIAIKLDITARTAELHTSHIIQKLGVRNRTAAALLYHGVRVS